MSAWSALALTAIVAVLVVLVPGVAVGLALRLRGPVLWGFAPATGVAVIAGAATGCRLAGIGWTPLSALLGVVALTCVAWAVTWPARRALPEVTRSAESSWVPLVASAAIGSLFGAVRMAMIIGAPANISQTNDATFHLNVLRFIEETGRASSLDVLETVGSSGFYPAAWHSVASLVGALTDADVVSIANAMSLAIAGPLWTLSISGFVWAVTRSRAAVVASALLSPTLFAFPFQMLDFGVLYPYALAVAIVPGVIAVLGDRAGVGAGGSWWPRASLLLLATLVGLVAIGLAQPSALLIWLIAAGSIAVFRLLAPWPTLSIRQRWVRVLGVIVIGGGAAGLWMAIGRISSDNLWVPVKPAAAAAVDMLVNGSAGSGPSVVISVLAVAGFIAAVRDAPLRWLALFGIVIAALVLVALSVQNENVRMLLSPWYADPRRFTAMMPLVVIPFAAIGVAAIARWKRWRNARVGAATATILVVLVYVETIAWAVINPVQYRYGESQDSYLSTDERALLDDLDEYVEPDARVIGNPSAGAAFGYGLSGVDVVPRTWSMPAGDDFQVLREDLADLTEDPAVCLAVDAMGVDYVLDFGESEDGPGKWEMPGLTGFTEGDGFELVAQRGDASLWRVTGCD